MNRDSKTMVTLLNDGAPTLEGPFGRAWDRSSVQLQPGDPNDWLACAASWIISSPVFHSLWDAWDMYAVSLRDIPGVEPAKKQFPEAEWEIGILSIVPESTVDLANPKGSIQRLAPMDLVHQIGPLATNDIYVLVREMARLIVQNGLSPDADNRNFWKEWITLRVKRMKGE